MKYYAFAKYYMVIFRNVVVMKIYAITNDTYYTMITGTRFGFINDMMISTMRHFARDIDLDFSYKYRVGSYFLKK